MILVPSSFSACFCRNVVSQPSVSPLCDLINECWAMRLDPLGGGHIWTLFTLTLSLFMFFTVSSLIQSSSSAFFPDYPFSSFYGANVYFSLWCCLISFPFLASGCLPTALFSFSCPLVFLSPPLNLRITSSLLHGGSCLPFYPGSPSPRLYVVPRSSPCLSLLGLALVHRMFKHRGEETQIIKWQK